MKRTALSLISLATFISVGSIPIFGQEAEERQTSRERAQEQEQRPNPERSLQDWRLQDGRPQEERLPGRRPPIQHPKQERLHGYFAVSPLRESTPEIVRAEVNAAATSTIPLFNYSIAGYDGNTYSGTMVGRSPFAHGSRTTNVHLFLIPIIFHMPDGGTFDPTAADACAAGKTDLSLVQGSPLLTPTDFVMNGVDVGTAQYVDAFQRASFWTDVSPTGARYHTVLSPVTVLSAVSVTVPTGMGQTWAASQFSVTGCGNLGVVDLHYWDPSLIGGTGNGEAGAILASLAAQGVGPTNFPILLTSNVVFADSGTNPTTNCCALGYHGSIGPVATLQTYSPLDFDTTTLFPPGNSSIMSHEVGEWMDDPVGLNPVPVWGAEGQVPAGSCQNNLEVGDPLSGTAFPSVTQNGFTYAFQELAFFSWFYGGTSLGSGGKYSNNGTFTGFAKACPPGGTN